MLASWPETCRMTECKGLIDGARPDGLVLWAQPRHPHGPNAVWNARLSRMAGAARRKLGRVQLRLAPRIGRAPPRRPRVSAMSNGPPRNRQCPRASARTCSASSASARRCSRRAAKQRSAELLADFENQMGQEYRFDEDEVWEKATKAAEREVAKAQAQVAARCRELGIPDRFAPALSLDWHDRGYDNLLEKRRDELRRMAQTQIEAIEAEGDRRDRNVVPRGSDEDRHRRAHLGRGARASSRACRRSRR